MFQFFLTRSKWVTDITYLIFNGQRLYLSAIKDLYNNEIVAYETSRRNDLKLVLDTLKKAKKKTKCEGNPLTIVIKGPSIHLVNIINYLQNIR